MSTHSERPQRQHLWKTWLFSQAADEGFTAAQVKAADVACSGVPSRFADVPSAAKDEDGNLCLAWRDDPRTLSVEIDQVGQQDWWAYSTDSRSAVVGRESIFAAVSVPPLPRAER